MTRIYHFDDGVTPPLDIDAIDRRRAGRSGAETAARQAQRDSTRIGRDAVALGELLLAAGNLERARDAFAIASRHQAPDATDLLHTVTELLDVLGSPVISGAAADTAMARTPADPGAEPEIVTLRAQELVRRLDELQARIERLTADANSAQAAISDARTRITAILEDARAQAAAIIEAAHQAADSTAQDTLTRGGEPSGVSGHARQKHLITPADADFAHEFARFKDVLLAYHGKRPRNDDVADFMTDSFVLLVKSSENLRGRLLYPRHPRPWPELRAEALPVAFNRVVFRVTVATCRVSRRRIDRMNDLLLRGLDRVSDLVPHAGLSRGLLDRWHAAGLTTQLDELKRAFNTLADEELAECGALHAATPELVASSHRSDWETLGAALAEVHVALTALTEQEPR